MPNQVRDEMCRCSHKRTRHENKGPAWGHAFCAVPGCQCNRYTWIKNLAPSKLATKRAHEALVIFDLEETIPIERCFRASHSSPQRRRLDG